jgi:hypothetical protein
VKRHLVIARALLGVLFLFRTSALSRHVHGVRAVVVGPLLGWPDGALVHTGLALPDAVAIALAVLRTVAAAAFVIGFRPRVTGSIAAACGFIALAQDPFGFVFTLHLMFLATAVYAYVDAREAHALAPSLTLVRLFAASIYFWAAIPKLRATWFSGDVLRNHLAMRDHGPLTDWLFGEHAQATAIATVVVELALPFALMSEKRHVRTVAVVVACAMHLTMEVTLHPDVFGWLMIILLIPFWPSRNRAELLR